MKRQRDNGFDEWGGYMEAKKSKLENQFKNEASKSGILVDNLFDGISIFVNGYTVPSADELRFMMMKHGGTYHHYYRSEKTTHVIASNLPDSKIKQLKNGLLVVKPEWIVDSIKEGKLLDYRNYLLYTNQSKTQPILKFQKNSEKSTSSPTKTASDEKFLSEFYGNSRLHLISTMGATFKQYVNELRAGKPEFPGLEILKSLGRTENNIWGEVVMHIDMDCFFVSVGLKQRPDLIGTPVAVTHSTGKKLSNDSMAEIASCSYEARSAGIKNGMFLGRALKLCPSLVTIPYDFEEYKKVSYMLYDTVARYTLNIEAVSCDEMFVDCTDLLTQTCLSPPEFASVLREEIKDRTGCTCSTGFGSNRLQARLATRKAKPNGQFYLEPDAVQDFMASVPVSDLPGVGRSTENKLRSMGIITCLDLKEVSLSTLQSEFGNKLGETLHLNSLGKDNKGLTFTKVRKSVSAEVNYGIRFQNDSERDKFLCQLCEEVSKRLDEVQMIGKSISLKIMVKAKDAPEESAKFLGHGICDYFTKSVSLKSATDKSSIILREVVTLMKQMNAPSKDLRGIGVQVSKLSPKSSSSHCLEDFFSSGNKPAETKMKRNTTPVKNKVPDSSLVPINLTEVKNSELQAPIPKYSEIDPSFLEALPEDIRSEILSIVKADPSWTPENFPSTSRKVEAPKENSNEDLTCDQSDGGPLSHITPAEMRTHLKEWIRSVDAPETCDSVLFVKYLTDLIGQREIEQLRLLLKTFYRELLRKDSCSLWKDVYGDTLDEVQKVMMSVYKSKLKIEDHFT